MADLIERDALLLKQKAHADLFADSTVHDDIVRRDEATAALAEIINAPAVNRWIPCSERLPILYVPVMILTDDGSYAIAHVTENEDEYLWFGDCGHYSKDYVLFWMPLPEPPEKE